MLLPRQELLGQREHRQNLGRQVFRVRESFGAQYYLGPGVPRIAHWRALGGAGRRSFGARRRFPNANSPLTSAMSSLSGLLMATGRKRALRLSGSLLRPPYFLPAGLRVTKMPAFKSTSISRPRSLADSQGQQHIEGIESSPFGSQGIKSCSKCEKRCDDVLSVLSDASFWPTLSARSLRSAFGSRLCLSQSWRRVRPR